MLSTWALQLKSCLNLQSGAGQQTLLEPLFATSCALILARRWVRFLQQQQHAVHTCLIRVNKWMKCFTHTYTRTNQQASGMICTKTKTKSINRFDNLPAGAFLTHCRHHLLASSFHSARQVLIFLDMTTCSKVEKDFLMKNQFRQFSRVFQSDWWRAVEIMIQRLSTLHQSDWKTRENWPIVKSHFCNVYLFE